MLKMSTERGQQNKFIPTSQIGLVEYWTNIPNIGSSLLLYQRYEHHFIRPSRTPFLYANFHHFLKLTEPSKFNERSLFLVCDTTHHSNLFLFLNFTQRFMRFNELTIFNPTIQYWYSCVVNLSQSVQYFLWSKFLREKIVR